MATIYVVHCIDAEGPLYESLEATFERIEDIFGLTLEPSQETLEELQRGERDLDVDEKAVQDVLAPRLLDYNETWDDINRMLADAVSTEFRTRFPDSRGNGWRYNWFPVDHVDYEANPRRRPMGYHQVFDYYRNLLDEADSRRDELGFHHHPHPIKDEAHRNATHWWINSDALYETLSRRIIDRDWFPAANRPGFHVTRPDSHWFLEQFIPFDYANQAKRTGDGADEQFDFANGRTGDWRRAPTTWEPYHPSHDDYQSVGNCRRWIARCLNVGTRHNILEEADVRQAFREAAAGKDVVLAFTNHDFRDIRPDVERVYDLLTAAAEEFPDVDFEYCGAVEAMRKAIDLPDVEPCDLQLSLQEPFDGAYVLHVETETASFGPQPYLAFKTVTGEYHHDNFDFQEPKHEWTYVFDQESLRIDAIETIGVGVNNVVGATTVARLDVETGLVDRTYWHAST